MPELVAFYKAVKQDKNGNDYLAIGIGTEVNGVQLSKFYNVFDADLEIEDFDKGDVVEITTDFDRKGREILKSLTVVSKGTGSVARGNRNFSRFKVEAADSKEDKPAF